VHHEGPDRSTSGPNIAKIGRNNYKTESTVEDWIRRFGERWEALDAAGAAELFTDDVHYRASPFEQTWHGRRVLRRRLAALMARQRDVRVWWGTPLRLADWAVLEWWASLEFDGIPSTVGGVSMIQFAAGGLCRQLHEYAVVSQGRLVPYAGWGHPRPVR
jgi:SnoaL-like domain